MRPFDLTPPIQLPLIGNGAADNIKRLLVINVGGEVGPPRRLHQGRVLRQSLAGISAPGQHTLASQGDLGERGLETSESVGRMSWNRARRASHTMGDCALAAHGTSPKRRRLYAEVARGPPSVVLGTMSLSPCNPVIAAKRANVVGPGTRTANATGN